MSHDFIPQKKNDLFEWADNALMPQIRSKHASWNVPSIEVLESKFNTYKTCYHVAENPETRTPAAVRAANTAQAEFVSELRKFLKSNVTYNPLVTEQDRVNMGLPLHDTNPTPVQPPNTYPEFEPDSSVIRRISLRFHNSGSASKAKPHGVHGAEIRWAILDSPPANIDEISKSAFATHSPHTMEFSEEQRGKSVYLCMRWETNRGDKGPWSEIVKAIIP